MKDDKNPFEEALVIGKLAEIGVGYELLFFEDETKIVVSRARSLGSGGWSETRFRRKIHGEVRRAVREIAQKLREHKIEFDLSVRKTDFGYSRGEFTVYSKIEDMRGLIHNFKVGDIQVKVKPVERRAIGYAPMHREEQKKLIIAGIDPGTTVGIAVLDLSLIHI